MDRLLTGLCILICRVRCCLGEAGFDKKLIGSRGRVAETDKGKKDLPMFVILTKTTACVVLQYTIDRKQYTINNYCFQLVLI